MTSTASRIDFCVHKTGSVRVLEVEASGQKKLVGARLAARLGVGETQRTLARRSEVAAAPSARGGWDLQSAALAPFVSVATALAALSAGPSAPVGGAAPGKPAALMAEKLDAVRPSVSAPAALGVFERGPEELLVSLCYELVVWSGTKVGCDKFEASEPGVLVVILPFPIFVAAAHVASILLGVTALFINVRGRRLGCQIGPVAVGGVEGSGGEVG
ncbi:hypothetical protein GUJ93_ZPchr0002g23890 [Zizania palustris]|uniref:Uncharacterized protein n=1 Tax=Zizania palustris TaxID=103762 RepID=A0A8J5SPX0_ZIZPA|nr:hypothetical protein GUJ93_ZPchr0002g23890 [Zizania palustris]